MMKANVLQEAMLPCLEAEDFEQMRVDTRNLVAENENLRRRIAHLEYQLVTRLWAGVQLH